VKAYTSPFQGWEQTAGVRWFSEQQMDIAGDGPWLPRTSFEHLRHPAVSHEALCGRNGAALLLVHLHMTRRLENELVGPVARWVAAGGLGPGDDLIMDAFRLQCDESFHALVCAGLTRRLASTYGIDATNFPEPLFLQHVRRLRAELADRVSPHHVDFAAVVVAETIVTKTLGEDWRDPEVRPCVRAFLKLHHEDEARHSACMAQALSVAWEVWDAPTRRAISEAWDDLCTSFIGPDVDASTAALAAAGEPVESVGTFGEALHASRATLIGGADLRMSRRALSRAAEALMSA